MTIAPLTLILLLLLVAGFVANFTKYGQLWTVAVFVILLVILLGIS